MKNVMTPCCNCSNKVKSFLGTLILLQALAKKLGEKTWHMFTRKAFFLLTNASQVAFLSVTLEDMLKCSLILIM